MTDLFRHLGRNQLFFLARSMAAATGRERLSRLFCRWSRELICPAACSTSAWKVVADRRRAPWPRMIICSAKSEVATRTRYFFRLSS